MGNIFHLFIRTQRTEKKVKTINYAYIVYFKYNTFLSRNMPFLLLYLSCSHLSRDQVTAFSLQTDAFFSRVNKSLLVISLITNIPLKFSKYKSWECSPSQPARLHNLPDNSKHQLVWHWPWILASVRGPSLVLNPNLWFSRHS